MSDYNGWTNRETWLVNVWFELIDQSDVDQAQEIIQEAYDKAPDFLRDFINISHIDWDELRSACEEEGPQS